MCLEPRRLSSRGSSPSTSVASLRRGQTRRRNRSRGSLQGGAAACRAFPLGEGTPMFRQGSPRRDAAGLEAAREGEAGEWLHHRTRLRGLTTRSCRPKGKPDDHRRKQWRVLSESLLQVEELVDVGKAWVSVDSLDEGLAEGEPVLNAATKARQLQLGECRQFAARQRRPM